MSSFSHVYRSNLSHSHKHGRTARRSAFATLEPMEARCLLAAAVAPDHIVVVIEQDRAANAIGDTLNMPYFNQLAATGLVYTNAHGVGHPSEPNTLAIYSGSTQGITDNGNLHTFTAPNLADSLNSKLVGTNYLSFAGYTENLPQDGDTTTPIAGNPGDPTAPPDLYERNVNPMAQFTNVGQRGSVTLTNAQVNKTFASFPTDAAGYAALPTVSYVIPNGLDNTHGSNEQPPYATDPAQYDFLRHSADTWLANHLDSYLQWAKTHNSLLIVISDEEETDTHPSTTITMIVNGDARLFVAGQNANSVNHYNLLRTITDMYGLPALGDTAAVADLDTDAQGRLAPSAANLGVTTTSLISSAPASLLGQSVTFTATVRGTGSPTGVVTFKDGLATLGTGTLNASGQATFTTSTLAGGVHSITAAYGGDSAFATSVSTAITQTVGVSNDNFANRAVISGAKVATTGTNAGATKEAGEPNNAGDAGGKSVWWSWTAPSAGTVAIDTIGSNFDTTLGVYTGAAVSALTLVKGDDDSGGSNTSLVSFPVTAGTVYQISVDGYTGRSGNVALNVNLTAAVAAPPNDNFANRVVISGAKVATTGTNVGATKEAGEPNNAGNAGGASVWWSWTAPSAGTVTIDTVGSNFDTTLGVYTGSAVSALTLVKGDDDSGGANTSQVSFAVTAGAVYQISVDGYTGRSGNIALNVNLTAAVAAPPNDNFANRAVISGTKATATGTNSGATKEAGEPNHAGNAGGTSVWWSWTAPSAGTVTIDTIGSNFDTILGVYTGSSVSALTLVKGDDDSGGANTSQVSFAVTAGTVYQIAVDGYAGRVGNIALNVNLSSTVAPANDSFAGRTAISGATVATTGTNVGATKETGEPSHAGNAGGKSVWWTWTAPASATVTIDTIGSDFDTLLAVYTGSSVSALTAVASNDDTGGITSKVSFAATAGTVYQIAVDGYAGVSGKIALNVSTAGVVAPQAPTGVAASNGTFTDRVRVTWTASANAAGYEVWRNTANNSASATKLNAVDITGTSYDDTTATAGTTYWYWVKAKNSGGTSDFSTSSSGYAAVGAPQAPTGVAASNGTFGDRVRVSWTASANAAGYEVWRNAANDSAAATKLNAVDVTGTSYDDTTAAPGTTYWYWVKAKNTAGTSGFSTGGSGYAAVGAPQAPTGVTASNGTFTDRVRVTWTASANAAGYEVWRNAANDIAAATKLNAVDITGTSYDDTTATAGTTYWYWVKAKNTSGTSGFSTSSSGYAAVGVPQAPTGVAASNGTFADRVRVTWTASANAAGYEVWRNTANNSASATKLNAADITGTSYDDTTATPGTTYWYWVKAKNTSGTSGFSAGSSGYAAVATPVNLALNRPATASSQESAALAPMYAVDGNTSTRWASGDWSHPTTPKWLMVDLGAVHSISAVNIRWEYAAAKTYQVQVSNDGTTWTTISSQTNGTDGLKSITGLSATGRYVRIYCTEAATAYGYSIWELQVMGV